MTQEKLPPHSMEAEEGVLGCWLINPAKTAVAVRAGVTSLDPAKLKQVGAGRPAEYTPEGLLELLGETRLRTVEWSRLAKQELGISSSTFFALLDQLEQTGQIQKSVLDNRWEQLNRRTGGGHEFGDN